MTWISYCLSVDLILLLKRHARDFMGSSNNRFSLPSLAFLDGPCFKLFRSIRLERGLGDRWAIALSGSGGNFCRKAVIGYLSLASPRHLIMDASKNMLGPKEGLL